jgi:hypothetical protein
MCIPKGRPDLFRRCRAAFNQGVQRAHSGPSDAASVRDALRSLELPLERAAERLEPKKLMSLARHESTDVRRHVAWLLGYFPKNRVLDVVLETLADPDVRSSALETLLRVAGPREAWAHVRQRDAALAEELIDMLEYWPGDPAIDVLRELAASEAGPLSARAAACLERVQAADAGVE